MPYSARRTANLRPFTSRSAPHAAHAHMTHRAPHAAGFTRRGVQPVPEPQATATGILPILACHSRGPVVCTEVPWASTATVTGMSFTSNS
ncbi:hypothetical protein BOFL111202_22270 [Bordetella flabilis]